MKFVNAQVSIFYMFQMLSIVSNVYFKPLLCLSGHRHMQTRLVEPSVESLNSGDAFLLVTEKYLYVWLGKDANVMKKSKVL